MLLIFYYKLLNYCTTVYRILGPEPVYRAVLQAECNDPPALTIFHDQIEGEVFHKIIAVIPEGLAVQGVQQTVTCPVGNAATPSYATVQSVSTIVFFFNINYEHLCA